MALVVLKIVALGGVDEKLVATESGIGVFTDPDCVFGAEVSPNKEVVIDFVASDKALSPAENNLLTEDSASDTIDSALLITLDTVEALPLVVVAEAVFGVAALVVNNPIIPLHFTDYFRSPWILIRLYRPVHS